MLRFVFIDHWRAAGLAALVFCAGVCASWAVVRLRVRVLWAWPVALFRLVMRLIGPEAGIARTAGVIFVFNGTVMFCCMAAGVRAVVPMVLGAWTGMNVGIVLGVARREQSARPPEPAAAGWQPAPLVALCCAALTLLLELPCFWFTLAMGVSLGRDVQAGAAYAEALAPRAEAFATVILPLLLASALAESVAVRGPAGADARPHG